MTDYIEIEAHSNVYKELLKSSRIKPITFLSGHKCSGKTMLINRALEELSVEFVTVYLNCRNQNTLIPTLDFIKTTLLNKVDNQNKKYNGIKVSTRESFFIFIDKFFDEFCKNVLIVFDHLDFTQDNAMPDVLTFLWNVAKQEIRLRILVCTSDCGIFDSYRRTVEKLAMKRRGLYIEIPAWTKNDLTKVIAARKPRQFAKEYELFVSNFIQLQFRKNASDMNTYYHTLYAECKKRFRSYIDQIKRGGKKSIGISAIGPFLESVKSGRDNCLPSKETVLNKQSAFMRLIISAYIAAYTRKTHDKKNFVKSGPRERHFRRKEFNDTTPKNFEAERLIHIYRALTKLQGFAVSYSDLSIELDNISREIPALEKTLIVCSSGDPLDNDCRYRISGSLNIKYLKNLSKLIRLDLDNISGIST